jgi:hypothetical protein
VTGTEPREQPPTTRSAIERLEILAAVLLTVATVATAWSSYEAARWNGEQAEAGARANALRIDSAKAESQSNILGSIDVTTFSQWVNAEATGRTELVEFYQTRFREEFQPAFQAWLGTDPLHNPAAPTTPFQMAEYVRADDVRAQELNAQADELVSEALTDLQNSSNYVLCVVLFAAALFFAGLSTRFSSRWPRRAVLALGSVVFLATLAWLLTLPVSFAV